MRSFSTGQFRINPGNRHGSFFANVDSSVWLDEIVCYRRKNILTRLQTAYGRELTQNPTSYRYRLPDPVSLLIRGGNQATLASAYQREADYLSIAAGSVSASALRTLSARTLKSSPQSFTL
jgi:hypothetical protein